MTKKMSASALVKKMPRETLESILLEHIGEDAALERHIIIEYGTSTTVAHYRELVDGMFRGISGWGYDGYEEGDAYDIAREIQEMFVKAEKKSVNEQANAVFAIAQAVIDGVIPRLDECDDHDGNLYDIVHEALGRVESVANAVDTNTALLGEIALWAKDLLSSGRLDGYGNGWAEQCTDILAATARTEAERAAFIEAHLDIDDVRELAIREAFAAKDFQRCKVLSAEGISRAEKDNLSGLVDGYRQSLIGAMDVLGAGKDADALVEQWTIEAWRDTWFMILKSRTPNAEWKETRERVLVALESKGKWASLLSSLYDSERLYDRLMTLCEKDQAVLVTYYRKLLKKFPTRVAPLLLTYIRQKAASDFNRSSYQRTAALAADYRVCAGVDAAAALIDELEAQYRARRAMREELEKVRPVRQPPAAKIKPLLHDLF